MSEETWALATLATEIYHALGVPIEGQELRSKLPFCLCKPSAVNLAWQTERIADGSFRCLNAGCQKPIARVSGNSDLDGLGELVGSIDIQSGIKPRRQARSIRWQCGCGKCSKLDERRQLRWTLSNLNKLKALHQAHCPWPPGRCRCLRKWCSDTEECCGSNQAARDKRKHESGDAAGAKAARKAVAQSDTNAAVAQSEPAPAGPSGSGVAQAETDVASQAAMAVVAFPFVSDHRGQQVRANILAEYAWLEARLREQPVSDELQSVFDLLSQVATKLKAAPDIMSTPELERSLDHAPQHAMPELPLLDAVDGAAGLLNVRSIDCSAAGASATFSQRDSFFTDFRLRILSLTHRVRSWPLQLRALRRRSLPLMLRQPAHCACCSARRRRRSARPRRYANKLSGP